MDKQIVIYTHPGILFACKKIVVFIHARTWMNHKNIVLLERNQPKINHRMYACIHVTIQHREIYGDRNGCLELRDGGVIE